MVNGHQCWFAAVCGERPSQSTQTVIIDPAVMHSGPAEIERHNPDRVIIDAIVKRTPIWPLAVIGESLRKTFPMVMIYRHYEIRQLERSDKLAES